MTTSHPPDARLRERAAMSTVASRREMLDLIRIERSFDSDAVQSLKSSADRDLTVAGPGLAASALRAGLVDEIHQLVSPIVVGGGTRFLPDDVRIELDLLDERRFANGVVFLRYATSH